MLTALDYAFSKYPVKKRVAEALYSLGISVRDSALFVGDFEVPIKSVSDALGVNRKTVYSFIETVEKDFVLKEIFSRLRPSPSLVDIAPILGYEVLIFSANSLNALKVLDYLRKSVTLVSFNFSDGKMTVVYEPRLSTDDVAFLASFVKDLKIITPDVKKQEMVCDKCKVEYCPRRVRHA